MSTKQLDRKYRPTVSSSRLRHVEARLQADADAVLREIAFVLAMTQRVKSDMSSEPEATELATV